MTDDRGQRLIELTREVLAAFLTDTDGYTTNIPEDVEIEELWHHPEGWGYVVRVSSTDWQPLDEAESVPYLTVEITTQP